jgi:hypothetical protein
MKLQIPSSKLQRNPKHQARNTACRARVWCLKVGISLVLGCWGLVLSAQPVPIDFSTAGYAANERPIPTAPVRVVVAPVKGDATARIQAAIDYVASLPPDANALRGAVLLLKGRHEVLGGLIITNSGIVLRGQGMGVDGTILVAAGLDRRTLIRIAGQVDFRAIGKPWAHTEDYLPVGATSFHLPDGQEVKTGDNIRIIRLSTSDWIKRLGADEFGGGEGGGWKQGTRDLIWLRTVKSVAGGLVTLDAPITTALEKQLGGGLGGARLQTYVWPGRLQNIGIENMRFESTFDPANPKDENHSWCAITMENTADAWVRQVTFKHFAGSAVALYETCQRITVQDCLSLAPVSEIGGYRRHTFFTMGQQTLFLRCFAEQGRHDFSVGHCAAGPNAFVQCEAREALDDSGPIESWASGVLYDNVNIDGNALTLGYRPGNNAGIGWAAANSVLWNCSASVIRCWNPPGATNWSFGSWASFEGDGVWKSSNDFMTPDSLFASQLKDRLGTNSGGASVPASRRLQLMPRPREESSNPPLDKAQELAAASHQPAPQLRDYILTASQRDPIPSEPGNAKRVEDLERGTPALLKAKDRSTQSRISALLITNGWLTIDGKLAIGGIANVAFWRGNLRPNEASNFGLAITRFVPGRSGASLTDDLNEVTDKLIANGDVALNHNYGLWYDRRRDDHERVRRSNGDVLPPFYEQPFARSGQGMAWDGLSKYDLTKFNPWYWSRLREFAAICEQRGLVLFHQNYFQHNILEAGAHWADFPWRAANNINETGFPEPPPYAGDKRIFQAELFYDVTHPVRRKLHEGYIRQCLENFKVNANVIQFTSAEFTGPLHFMQFWLDTVAAWEVAAGILPAVEPGFQPGGKSADSTNRVESLKSTAISSANPGGRMPPSTAGKMPAATRPIIALSATKDVQDAILADATRSAIVDVIDFRYWWRTDNGEFAPPGGKNLAPRQFERRWKGGRPTDENLARMAAEYRAKFPIKPLICDFDTAGWAWLCAGGSMPRLPQSTDARLLAAIPKMQPWTEAANRGRWALREAGKQMLIYGRGEVDLSGETGTFRVNVVNPQSGEVTPGNIATGGSKEELPNATVTWLTKEN